MFNDFAVVIRPKDVDSGPIMVPWPFLEAVEYDKLPAGEFCSKFENFRR
jgi:hypothetical protein